MSDWMFDDCSAEALLNQDYAPTGPLVHDDIVETQIAPYQDPLSTGGAPEGDDLEDLTYVFPRHNDAVFSGGGRWQTDTAWLDDGTEEPLPCTPPPDGPTPAGVDVGELRDIARDAANDIRERDNSVEWGALFYELDGQLHSTRVVSQNSSSSIGFNYSDSTFLPDGARIVGWIHNHPYERGTGRQDGFGADDEAGIDTMIREASRSGGRFSADPNMMTYTIPNDSDRDASNDPLLDFDEEASRNARGTVIGPCRGS